MAATKNDELLGRVFDLLREITLSDLSQQHVLHDVEQGLNDEEALELDAIRERVVKLWDSYLDRMIEKAASAHSAPEAAVAAAGADGDEMIAARERVRAKLIARGVPLGGSKKVIH